MQRQNRGKWTVICIVLFFRLLSLPVCAQENAEVWKMPDSVYSSHMNDQNKIAITFDDGPHPVYTGVILDILKEYGVHATFFMIGENAEKYPELVKRIQQEGHEIGNHTYLHGNLKKFSAPAIMSEIQRAEDVLLEIGDQRPKLLRPPGGLYNEKVCEAATALDYDIILWTIDTKDWAHTPSDVIVKNVEDHIKCGDIILCHDFIGGKPSPTPDALRKIIPELLCRGYAFVTVSELIHSN